MVLNLAVACPDSVRAFVRTYFFSCKRSVSVSIQYKYVTTSVSKKRTFASTEKLRGKNESTLRARQTKRRQQFGGNPRHIRYHPVLIRCRCCDAIIPSIVRDSLVALVGAIAAACHSSDLRLCGVNMVIVAGKTGGFGTCKILVRVFQ